MKDIEQYRPGFEAWYAPKFAGGELANMPRRPNGEYVRPQCEIAWQSWVASKLEASTEPSAIPDVLFDGSAVYDEIVLVKGHCAHYVVSDTLDAVVRLMRKAGAGAAQKDEARNG